MTVSADAARQAAAERYQIGSVQADADYRQRAQADIDQCLAAGAAASRDVVIVNGVEVTPGSPVPAVQPTQPAVATPPAPTGQRLAPLPVLGDRQPMPAADLLKQMRANGAAAIALKDWPTVEADMPFAAAPMAMVVNGMPGDDAALVLGALEEAFDLRPSVRVTFMRALAGLGRQAATVAGDPASITTTTHSPSKGSTVPTYEFKGSPAELKKQYDNLTPAIHDARFRGDHMKVRELAAQREALGQVLFPGSSGPSPDQQRTIG